jgi:hypothetical protein
MEATGMYPNMRWAAGLQSSPPLQLEIKKTIFYRWDDISGFTGFTLLPKSATENGLPLVNWNFKK